MGEFVTSTAYLVIEGRRTEWSTTLYDDGRVVAVRAKKPAALLNDQVAVKVTIKIPKPAFDALIPEAEVVVPAEQVQRRVHVEPVDPL